MERATLTFGVYKDAQRFASQWSRATLTGYDLSAMDEAGGGKVTVHDVNQDKKEWIEQYIAKYT